MNQYSGSTSKLRPVLRHPRAKLIFVDVDKTLLSQKGEPNQRLIVFLRAKQKEGFSFVLWSARGKKHAAKAACKASCADLFESIIGKPGYIIDDKGWGWTRFVKRLTHFHI